jgi:hypothetical protein
VRCLDLARLNQQLDGAHEDRPLVAFRSHERRLSSFGE